MANWTRRRFLGATAALGTLPLSRATGAPKPASGTIPRRPLGKTGMNVSILGLGGGSQFLSACKTDDEAVEMLNACWDGNINYYDSAWSYGNGESLRRYGLVLPKWRRAGREFYVTSKTLQRTRDAALKEVESSLKNVGLDHLDLIQIHLIKPDENLDAITAPGGVFPALLELKAQKVVRNVGITGHLAAVNMKTLIGRMEGLDTVLCPVNPFKDSRHYLDKRDPAEPNGHFEELVLPAALEKGLGIIAMKTMAQGQLVGDGPGKTTAANLLRYALSQPGVAVAIVGPGSMKFLRQNLQTAQNFTPLSPEESKRLEVAVEATTHRFAYREPEYRGG